VAALNLYWANDLTGGGNGALDKIPTAKLLDKYGVLVLKSNYLYAYECDDDLGGSESSPWLIIPDDEAGNKRLNLLGVIAEDIKTKSAKLYDTNQSNTLNLTWNEGATSDYTLNLAVGGASRTLTLNENFTIGDGYAGTLTFSAASKTLTVEDTSVLNQDLTADANVTFGTINALTLTAAATGFTVVGGTAPKTITADDDFVVSTQLAAISANTDKVTCSFTNVQAALAAATGAVAFNSQNLTGVGAIGCGAITLGGDLITDRWDSSPTNLYLGVGVCGTGSASGATYNVCVGASAGYHLTSGNNNSFMGAHAGVFNDDGINNVAIGTTALYYNQGGQWNICIGKAAGQGLSAGDYHQNIFIGGNAGYSINSGGNLNTGIGYRSLFAITTGNNNICIGMQSGDILTTGSNNIVIGHDIDPSANNATSEINIGGTIFGKIDTKRAGINVQAPLAQLHIDQSVADAAIPVLTLDQGDVSKQCIKFSSDGVDRDVHLFTVDVTGVPTFDWIEASDRFSISKGLILPADGVIGVTDGNPQIVFDNANNWLEITGAVGIGTDTPTAKLHIDQSVADAAIPVLTLDQGDVSEEFIRFIGTSADGVLTQSIVETADVGTATLAGYVKVYVQDDGDQLADQAYFMPIYTLAA